MFSERIGQKTEVLSHFSVPRGTREKLERFISLLCEQNKKTNLVSAASLTDVWTRHVLDSLQLIDYVPASAKRLVDLGSGAGFPGLVLAIAGVPDVHLIESIGKKAAFLESVIRQLNLAATVHHERIESLRGLKADVITARALKPLPELLALAWPLMHEKTICLFLKGQKADAELTEAGKYWTFECEKSASISDPSGSVLTITSLKERRPHALRRRPTRKHR